MVDVKIYILEAEVCVLDSMNLT